VAALERKSRFYVTCKVFSKNATEVADALIEMLKPFQSLVHTITADNGLEFAEHMRVAVALDTDVYFADPYASYQRGANENTNGLLRNYSGVFQATINLISSDPIQNWAAKHGNTFCLEPA